MSITDAAAAPLPEPNPENLPDDPVTLKSMILELLATLRAERHEQTQLRERLHLLLQRLHGRRGEGYHADHPLLFPELQDANAMTPTADEATEHPGEEDTSQQPRRRGHGRKPAPKNLPHETVHHCLTEAERACPTCGTQRQDIGTSSTSQLDYRPASIFVIDHVEHKYACPCCSQQGTPQIVAAIKPEQPLGKGSPGAGLLAYLIVSKYLDHLPLYRLESILQRQGLDVARSTTCDWMAGCARRLQPLYDLMREFVLQSRVLHTDDTPVKQQGATTPARVWVYLGDPQQPYNVFHFTTTRRRDGPQEFLKTYRGYLQADAFTGYDALYLPDAQTGQARVIEVACNAHARRKFYEARLANAAGAHQALAYYGQLYEIEQQAKKHQLTDEALVRMRQDLAVPILEAFHTWLEGQQRGALPKSKFGEAVQYALNQWSALCRYTEASFLSIDNNWAEREMKRIAIGRKNWLFFGSSKGGETAAVLISFTSTCRRLGVEPWAYLKDVLTRLPTTSAEQLADLLPDRWQAAQKLVQAPTATSQPSA